MRFLERKPLDADELRLAPKILRFPVSEALNMGDFATNRSALILSRKAAEILEAVEPGRHQIIPLQIESSKRYREKLENMGHYLVHVWQNVQAVDIEKSALRQNVLTPPPTLPHLKAVVYYHIDLETPDGLPRIVVKPEIAHGLHLWSGADRVLGQTLFVSEKLKNAWQAAGCGPMHYFPCAAI